MLYSNACAYAIRALIRLTRIRPDGYVLLDELCNDTTLPRHFVAKIFQGLVRKGLLKSAKGRGGGFALASKPEQTTLAQVVIAIDGDDVLDRAQLGICDEAGPALPRWRPVGDQVRSYLEQTTLRDLANG